MATSDFSAGPDINIRRKGCKPMNAKKYLAYLRIRRFDTREIVHSVGVSNLGEGYIERVMYGMLINMNTDQYFIDDSEVDEARKERERK